MPRLITSVTSLTLNPAFLVRGNTNTSLGNNVKIPFATVDFDVRGNFDNTNDRFVAPVPGLFFFYFSTAFDTNGVRVQEIGFKKNGTSVGIVSSVSQENWGSPANEHPGLSVSGTIELNATDYVEVWSLAHSAVTSGNIRSNTSSFGGFLVQARD